MTIQKKTLLIVLFGLAITISIIYMISSVIVTSSFQKLENVYARTSTQRVFQVLENELEHMSTFAETYANWQELFRHYDSSATGDALANLTRGRPTSRVLNLIIYYDSDGSLEYSNFIDNELNELQRLPDDWRANMSPNHPLFIPGDNRGEANGLLKLPDGTTLLVNSILIQQSGQKNSKATLILGQLFNPGKIQQLIKVSNESLVLQTIEEAITDKLDSSFYKSLSMNAPVAVRVLDEQTINGFLLLKDIHNRPAFVLKISFPRDIYQQGKITLEYYARLLILIGITIVLFVLVLMDRLVLSRLKRLNKGIRKVQTSGDFNQHIEISGDDEFKYLADIFNELLKNLQLSLAELELYQDKLRQLMSELVLVEEKERRRISVELHDNTIQNLGLSKFRLSIFKNTLDKNISTHILDEVISTIDKAIIDTRNLIFELSPPVLYELGFVPAIEWLAEKFHLERGLECAVNADGEIELPDNAISVISFQIVRELLVNIVKHANTEKAIISLSREEEKIRIEVRDYGVGFDVSSLNNSIAEPQQYGLFSIRERLNSLGEKLEIESSPGVGTKISFSVPFKSTN